MFTSVTGMYKDSLQLRDRFVELADDVVKPAALRLQFPRRGAENPMHLKHI